MAPLAGRVFVSYSRRDYYFAESLSLQLLQHGVPAWMDVLELQPGSDWQASLFEAVDGCAAFVLVASPAALASPHVRAEWQRALAQRRRVLLLGWQQRVRLPPELQGCEWLDFRGRFAPALARLAALLAAPAPPAPPAGARPGRGPWAPPAVLAVLAGLVLPIAAYAFGVAPDVARQDFADSGLGLSALGGQLLFALLSAAMVWALSFSLLQRRMGMTRLMLCLAFIATPFVLAAWKIARHGAQGMEGTPSLVAQRVLDNLPAVWVLAALPLLVMAWIGWARPLGLLHWMPTGKAWERDRLHRAAGAPLPIASAQALATVRRFRLLHDAADAPLAAWLRAALCRQGASSVEAPGPGTSTVLLLSNRSSRDWLALQSGLAAEPALLSVVGSAIGLVPELDWLWRRQWIDLRQGSLASALAQPRLPSLPEAVTQLRLPAPLARLHALLCAYAVLMGLLGQLLTPAAQATSEDASVPMVLGAVLFVALAWCARRLCRRELPQAALRRWLALGLPLGMVFAAAATGLGELSPAARAAGVLGTLAAAVLAGLAWRLLPRVQPWLPDVAIGVPRSRRLAPPADWRTLLTVTACLFAWMLPVQLFAPQLMAR